MFLVFAGWNYYPSGGAGDLIAIIFPEADNAEQAEQAAKDAAIKTLAGTNDWSHVLKVVQGDESRVIFRASRDGLGKITEVPL